MSINRAKFFEEEWGTGNKESFYLCHDEQHEKLPDVGRVYILHEYTRVIATGKHIEGANELELVEFLLGRGEAQKKFMEMTSLLARV
jgi:hypothetical protein